MADIDDGYAAYYAQRLWALLPSIYRTEDSDAYGTPGPLQELLVRVGAQVAVVRRSLDRLWADQSIETCDDWVIPYIGDLLGTNLVNGLDARGHRLDVAKTIHYRRRKGTLAVLEELARDVTGWDAHVVEGFRRLARTRHGLDPMVGGAAFPNAGAPEVARLLTHEGLVGALSATPAGGLADLRGVHAAALTGSAFDEYFHIADMRAGRGSVGHFGIPKLLVFLWRLASFPITAGTPVAVAGCPGQYVFDPTGRQTPLFLPPSPTAEDFADTWTTAYEWQVPGPITTSLEQALAAAGTQAPYPNPPSVVPFGYTVSGATVDGVWPELGRFQIPAAGTPPAPLTVGYQYGFSGDLGAGPYDRLLLGDPPHQAGSTVTSVSGGNGLDSALSAVGPTGTVEIADSLTYVARADVGTAAAPIVDVLVAAAAQQRPVMRPAVTTPGDAPSLWVFTGAGDAQLTLDGLLVCGCDIVLRGSFDTVRITACTLDPGTVDRTDTPAQSPLAVAVDGQPLRPTTIWIEADGPGPAPPPAGSGSSAIRRLLIDHSIVGPIRTRYGGSVEAVSISDSIVQAIPTTVGPHFSAADVYDPALLAAGLTAKDPLSEALLAALPVTAEAAVHNYQAPAPVPQELIDGLNDVVDGPSLWDPARFATVTLNPDVWAMTKAAQPSAAAVAALNRALLDAALPVALGLASVAVSNATVSLARVSVLGALAVHRLTASDSVIAGFAVVDDSQDGCVRFSAYVGGSQIPRQYESVTIGLGAALFTSADYGNPGYAQLLDAVDQAITGGATGATISAGADTGSQMGAFSSGLAPIKEQGLLIKYAEYMPLGITPVIIHVT